MAARSGELRCAHCGDGFAARPGPLGQKLCPDCLVPLTKMYIELGAHRTSTDFKVGSDSIKQWARLNHLRREGACANCGRLFSYGQGPATPLCPTCATKKLIAGGWR